MQQGMVFQVARLLGRARAGQQLGAAHGNHLDRQAQLGMQARIVAAAIADGQVEIVAVEVDGVVGGGDLEIDRGVIFHEAVHARDEPFDGKGRRHVDLERRQVLAVQALCGVGQLLECLLHTRQVCHAGRGQHQRLGLAQEQLHAEAFLQRLDLVADGGRRDVQLVGRPREAEMPGRNLESSQRIQRGHLSRHAGLSNGSQKQGIEKAGQDGYAPGPGRGPNRWTTPSQPD